MACVDCGKEKRDAKRKQKEVTEVDYTRVRHRVENRTKNPVTVRNREGKTFTFPPGFRGSVEADFVTQAGGALYVLDKAAREALTGSTKAPTAKATTKKE